MNETIEVIAEAFSRTAEKYDAFAEGHPHLTRMRNKVYRHIGRLLPPGSHILELNAGSGVDAVHLAQQGYYVHATDVAPGMLDRLRVKIDTLGLQERVTIQECSYTDLAQVQGGPYDAIFSDMGGLNCIQDLSEVVRDLPRVLRPGGLVTWVLMPPVCLWEIAEILRGHAHLAFRRFSRGGTQSHLEGLRFPVYYFSPGRALHYFGEEYQRLALEGLSVITPTAESKNFINNFPTLYGILAWLDDRLATRWPWYGWGDFYILSMRYSAEQRR